ncbi:hypothetical protein Pelo_404 [Pelomyxa schiedti]|nr:hypothetical protein Pelo_404 [Pelomyxa schiedti]
MPHGQYNCLVVGTESLVDEFFMTLVRAGIAKTAKMSAGAAPAIHVRTGQSTPARPEDPRFVTLAHFADKVVVFCEPTRPSGPRMRYAFYRCCRGDNILRPRLHSTSSGGGGYKCICAVLHTVEDRLSFKAIPETLHKVLETYSSQNISGDTVMSDSALIMVDCTDSSMSVADRTVTVHTLQAIEMAFTFCAFKLLKWELPKPKTTLDTLISLLTEASSQSISFSEPRGPFYVGDWDLGEPMEVHIPPVFEIACADAKTAHTIMQMVHDFRPHLPFFTTTMALTTWVKAKNWAAVGVVYLARSISQFEDFSLPLLEMDSVAAPDDARALLCHWMAEIPNAKWGCNGVSSGVKQDPEPGYQQVKNAHKLVIVGDSGAGKTTLLRCMMERKRKMTTKHIPTGLAVHHDVRFRSKVHWTVWDLGGDSLSPFHPWFLLSRSIFIIVFDLFEALKGGSAQKARVSRWLNEITVGRSMGDKTTRRIIPVGTHMESVVDSGNFVSLMKPLFVHENIHEAFLIELSDGTGCMYSPARGRTSIKPESKVMDLLVSLIEDECRDDGTHYVPSSWIVLNKYLRNMKEGTSSLRWTKFVALGTKCGVSGRRGEIEECAYFLASIGTIIHFRYPFWVQHTGSTHGLSDLVILEPYSFLNRLIADACKECSAEHSTSTLLTSTPTPRVALSYILEEFCGINTLLSSSNSFSPEQQSLSLFPLSHTTSSWGELKRTEHVLKSQGATTSSNVTMNGRLIKFPLFPQELFFKAISRALSCVSMLSGWRTEFCWRDTFILSNSCTHDGKTQEGITLVMTCQDDRVAICMRSECSEHWALAKQWSLWAGLVGTLYHFSWVNLSRFEEDSFFEWNATHWFDPADKPVALPFSSSCTYFLRGDVVDAHKKGVQLTCKNVGTFQVDVALVAPDLVSHSDTVYIPATLPTTTTPPPSIEALRPDVSNKPTLGDLLARLIQEGNGTTSALDQVVSISLRMKILRDVAQGLSTCHSLKPPIVHLRMKILRDVAQGLSTCHSLKPPIVQYKLSPAAIIVLSLDDSGAGPWAMIRETDGHCPLFSDCSIIPAQRNIPPDEIEFLAPEILSHWVFDTKADVWSFGITASLLLDPLNKPYTHIATDKKYLATDYSSQGLVSQNEPQLHPMSIGRALLYGNLKPFPSLTGKQKQTTTSVEATGNGDSTSNINNRDQQQIYLELGNQITSICLEPNPDTRPSIEAVIKIWDYFVPKGVQTTDP